ncbi:MAG: hypothetical protein ACRBBS_09405 [Thalassovita sp.]
MSTQTSSLWHRHGPIITVPKGHPQWATHCQYPTVYKRSPRHWWLFFTARDALNRAMVMRADLDPTDGMRVRAVTAEPLLRAGIGAFSDVDGVGVMGVFDHAGQRYSLVNDFRTLPDTTYTMRIRLLPGPDDAGQYDPNARPRTLLGSKANDRSFYAAPCLLSGPKGFVMWYTCGVGWSLQTTPFAEPHYDIRRVTSPDLQAWTRDEGPAIPRHTAQGESGHTRPSVLQSGSDYEMWYCTRGFYTDPNPAARHYSIGYARSRDGVRFERADAEFAFANPPQPEEWDAHMQSHPQVVRCDDGQDYMFYTGNDYGRFSLGYATRVSI